MKGGKDFKWHLTAIVVVGIWGMTFISTLLLIENGLTPQEIFLPLERVLHHALVAPPVGLRAQRPDGGALAPVEHAVLNAG